MPNSEIEDYCNLEVNNYSICKVCGETFQNPLYATMFSENQKLEFYACPRCLSEVKHVGTNSAPEKDEEVSLIQKDGDALVEWKTEVELEAMPEEKINCAYEFGYLRRRPKDAPIPDQCLTCPRMIDCM